MPISTRNLVTVLAISLVATSCIKSEISIDVNNDQSAEVVTIVAYDAEQLGGLAELGGEDLGELGDLDFCQETFDGLAEEQAEGVEVEEYDEDGFCGAKITAQVEASDDINQAIQDSLQGSDELASGEQDITLEKIADDEWNFTVQLEEGGLAGALDESGDLDGMEGMFGAVLDDFEVKYVVSLPGSETTSNADEVSSSGDKTTFTWALGIDSTLSELTASTEPGSGFDTGILKWIAIGLIALAALAGILFFLKSRNKSEPHYDQHGYQTSGPAADSPAYGTPDGNVPPQGQQQFQQFPAQGSAVPPVAAPSEVSMEAPSSMGDPLDPYAAGNGVPEAPATAPGESETQDPVVDHVENVVDETNLDTPPDSNPKDA